MVKYAFFSSNVASRWYALLEKRPPKGRRGFLHSKIWRENGRHWNMIMSMFMTVLSRLRRSECVELRSVAATRATSVTGWRSSYCQGHLADLNDDYDDEKDRSDGNV